MKILEIAEYLKSVNFSEELKKRIRIFHNICYQPATGTICEGLLYKSLQAVGVDVNWEPMSHCQEKDMSISICGNTANLSLKSSKCNKTRIPISSYRTTSAKTLEEKLDLIEKLDAELDAIFVFSRFHSSKHNVLPDYYKIYLIDPEFLSPKTFEWQEDRNKDGVLKGWRTHKNLKDTNLGIVKTLSDQVWYDLGKSCLDKYPNMIIELMEIGV